MASILKNVVPPVVYKTVVGDYGFSSARIPNLAGRCVVLTGGTNGIGLSAARALYAHSARVVLLSSTKETADQAMAYIRSGDIQQAPSDFREGFGKTSDKESALQQDEIAGGEKGEVVWKKVSLEDLKEVRKVAEEILQEEKRLDVLLGVAGIGVNEFEATNEGYDKHLVINNLSHVLLANRLLPLLRKTAELPGADVRVVHMSSELHRATMGGPSKLLGGTKFASKDEFKEELGPSNLYARTKLATILFTKGLAQKLSDRKIGVFATHPGAVSTGQQDQFQPAYGEIPGKILGAAVSWAMRNPDEGAMSLLWTATSPEARDQKYAQGTYFTDPNELGQESSESKDEEMISNFWANSQEIIKEVAGQDALVGWEEKA